MFHVDLTRIRRVCTLRERSDGEYVAVQQGRRQRFNIPRGLKWDEFISKGCELLEAAALYPALSPVRFSW